jgi:hypothetical protein
MTQFKKPNLTRRYYQLQVSVQATNSSARNNDGTDQQKSDRQMHVSARCWK